MSIPVTSRGPLGLAAAVLAGGVSVAFLLAALLHMNSGLVGLGYFAAVPLYLAGLGAGALAGIVATVTGIVALYVTEPHQFAVLYAVAYGIPAVILTRLALRRRVDTNGNAVWYPEGDLLTAITIYPCVLFLAANAVATSHPGGLLDLTRQAFDQSSTEFAAQFSDDQAELFHRSVAKIAVIAPAFLSYSWIMIAILSLAGAQYILRQQKFNLRDRFSLSNLYLPTQLIYGVAMTGVIGVFAPAPYDYIGNNLAMILGLPFFFVGLAVVHALAAAAPRPNVVLFFFYGVLLCMPAASLFVPVLGILLPVFALFIAALGVVDQWADFRQRIANKTNQLT